VVNRDRRRSGSNRPASLDIGGEPADVGAEFDEVGNSAGVLVGWLGGGR
jgi:hypothetical protein